MGTLSVWTISPFVISFRRYCLRNIIMAGTYQLDPTQKMSLFLICLALLIFFIKIIWVKCMDGFLKHKFAYIHVRRGYNIIQHKIPLHLSLIGSLCDNFETFIPALCLLWTPSWIYANYQFSPKLPFGQPS